MITLPGATKLPGGLKILVTTCWAFPPPAAPPPPPPPPLLSDEICGGLVITPLAWTMLWMTVYCTGAVNRVSPGAAVSAACSAGDLMVVDTSSPPTAAITASAAIASRMLRRRRRRPCPGLSTTGTSTPISLSCRKLLLQAPAAWRRSPAPPPFSLAAAAPAKMSTRQRAIRFRDPGFLLPLLRRRMGSRRCQAVLNPHRRTGPGLAGPGPEILTCPVSAAHPLLLGT